LHGHPSASRGTKLAPATGCIDPDEGWVEIISQAFRASCVWAGHCWRRRAGLLKIQNTMTPSSILDATIPRRQDKICLEDALPVRAAKYFHSSIES
jgi:hypothetical protein